MNITEVRFEKLFFLEKYNNERFGFTATLADGESADKAMAELAIKVLAIEDCFATYRQLQSIEESEQNECHYTEDRIESLKDEANKMKVRIDELAAAIKAGQAYDEKLQHACSNKSYKELIEQTKDQKKTLKEQQANYTTALENRKKLEQRIKTGNFSLEGVDVPRIRRRGGYY